MKKIQNLVYPARIIFDKEDKVYLVTFPNFDYCVTDGKTLDIAKEMATEALSLCLDSLVDDNQEFPEPLILDEKNCYLITAVLGKSTYTKHHKKYREKNKDKIASDKKQKESEMLKNGYKNFKTFLANETVLKLDKIVKSTKTSRQVFLTKLIEDEFKKFPVLSEK